MSINIHGCHFIREGARGGAGGAAAPPIFQDLVGKGIEPKNSEKKIPFIGGYPNFKFLMSSL